jgi:hypothetical protein
LYYVLEQIHTLPNVNYLAKVRNTDILTAAHPTEDELSEPEKKTETHFSK